MGDEMTIIFCGRKACDHDWEGPEIFYIRGGGATFDRKEAEEKGCSGGAATCSKCGEDALNDSLWRGV